MRYLSRLLLALCLASAVAYAGEAQQRWELMNQIRQDKFDLVLPEVMRENGIDMWITVIREGYNDPLTEDFGKGYVGELRLADGERPLIALEDDPRYRAIQTRMIENLNAQRAALGLESAEI